MIGKEKRKEYKKAIAPALPFPPISWWKAALQAEETTIDCGEFFQKMTYRNRYYLADKKGKPLLSIPLENGRNQRIAMNEMQISYAENWQKNHWKTLQTLLGNSPFFEYIDYQIQPFFENHFERLCEFNRASIIWANTFLGNLLQLSFSEDYIRSEKDFLDLRQTIHPKNETATKPYYQVFATDSGFLPDCSILDLICCEGKNAINILKQ